MEGLLLTGPTLSSFKSMEWGFSMHFKIVLETKHTAYTNIWIKTLDFFPTYNADQPKIGNMVPTGAPNDSLMDQIRLHMQEA